MKWAPSRSKQSRLWHAVSDRRPGMALCHTDYFVDLDFERDEPTHGRKCQLCVELLARNERERRGAVIEPDIENAHQATEIVESDQSLRQSNENR